VSRTGRSASRERSSDEVAKLKRQTETLKAELRAAERKLAEQSEALEKLSRQLEEANKLARKSDLYKSYAQKLQERLDNEALEIQKRLLPRTVPEVDGLRICVEYRPARRPAGDFYDFARLDNGRLAILIGDASGYGLSSVLVSAMTKMVFGNCVAEYRSPSKTLSEMNRQLLDTFLPGQFVAAFLAVIEYPTMRMVYSNAAHCCPVRVNKRRKKAGFLDTEGSFLGIFEDAHFEEKEIKLQLGDRIIMHSDGVAKAFAAAGEAHADSSLHDIILQNADLNAEGIIRLIAEDVLEHGEEKVVDDLTFIGLDIVPREATHERFVIRSDPREIAFVDEAIRRAMIRKGYGERDLFAVKLALEEAIINAMKHGNRMDRRKHVTIDFRIDDEGIVLEVEDEGEGFDPSSVPDPTRDENIEQPHGRGIILMKAYMDRIKFNLKGNKVTMMKFSPWAHS